MNTREKDKIVHFFRDQRHREQEQHRSEEKPRLKYLMRPDAHVNEWGAATYFVQCIDAKRRLSWQRQD